MAHPCDPVSRDPRQDCPGSDAPTITTITADTVSYVVYAAPSGSNVEVREVLVLPHTKGMIPLDAGGAPVPSALDARTGETLPIAAHGPGLCEIDGACVIWGWYEDARHLDFDDAPPPRADL